MPRLTASLVAAALALAACSDDDLDRVELPVGETFVSQRIVRDLEPSVIPEASRVTLSFPTDSTYLLEAPASTCRGPLARVGPVAWRGGGGGCAEGCCSTALAEEIAALVGTGELRVGDVTVTVGNDTASVIFQ